MQEDRLSPAVFMQCIDTGVVPHLFRHRAYTVHRTGPPDGVLWYFVQGIDGEHLMQIDARANWRKLQASVAIGEASIELVINYRSGEITVMVEETGSTITRIEPFNYQRMFIVLMQHCARLLATPPANR